MGCLLKLIVLPLWWTFRLALLGVRAALRRTTPLHFLGYLFGVVVAIVSPAALLGALALRFGAAWYRTHARRSLRWPVIAALDICAIALLVIGILLWRLALAPPYLITSAWGAEFVTGVVLGLLLPGLGHPDSWSYLGFLFQPARFLATWGAGLLLAPAVYLAFTLFFRLPDLARQLRTQALFEARWRRAVRPRYQSLALRRALKRGRGHPFGLVRWGWDQVNDRPYDIEPASLARHLTLLGVTGSGKTTAIARLAEGLLHQDWAVLFLDCKGGGLRQTSERLARACGATYRLVDPAFPDRTLHYNPCSGTPADVSNKLVGALSFGEGGEVYKQVGQLALGLLAASFQALKRPVTLTSLVAGLTPESMRGLIGELAKAGKPELATEVKDRLAGDRLSTEAMATLRARLANFQRSHFAPILSDAKRDKTLDLDDALAGGVTYISLPATAASEDVPLMGRILLQDLKQAVARREHHLGGFAQRLPTAMSLAIAGVRVRNTLLVIDEFAALQDPIQLQDLLLQARSAGVTLALSSQLMPQDPVLAAAVKGVGLVASLRVSDVDAQQVSDLFGTYNALEVTHQSGEFGGSTALTGTGSVREVQRYIAHPNDIKRLPDAIAVVKLDHIAGRGRTVTAVRFWPADADWPEALAYPSAPAAMAASPLEEVPYADLPWLPDPPGLDAI